MTCGRIIFIENENSILKKHISDLYEDNMSKEELGEKIINSLEKVNTRKEFENYLYSFTKQNFFNNKIKFSMYMIDGNRLVVTNNYNGMNIEWISDFIYIKNASDVTIKVLLNDNKIEELLPNKIIVVEYSYMVKFF